MYGPSDKEWGCMLLMVMVFGYGVFSAVVWGVAYLMAHIHWS